MAYSPQQWNDYPTGGTPISAARLNHMEAGIANAGSTASADAALAVANQANATANSALAAGNNAQAGVNALNAEFKPATGAFSVGSGWTVNRQNIIKVGRVATCDISVTRSGGTITVGSSGNIANTLIGTVTGTFTPVFQYAGLTAGPGGAVNSVYLQGTSIYIAAYAPSTNITNGTEITFAGPWITAS